MAFTYTSISYEKLALCYIENLETGSVTDTSKDAAFQA